MPHQTSFEESLAGSDRRADRSGAPWAAVIGDTEAAEGVVLLKDLRGETAERRFTPNQLVELLKSGRCAPAP